MSEHDAQSSRRYKERMDNVISLLKDKNKLLQEAYLRFKKYEMDVDDYPPYDHIEFMKKLKQAIGE